MWALQHIERCRMVKMMTMILVKLSIFLLHCVKPNPKNEKEREDLVLECNVKGKGVSERSFFY